MSAGGLGQELQEDSVVFKVCHPCESKVRLEDETKGTQCPCIAAIPAAMCSHFVCWERARPALDETVHMRIEFLGVYQLFPLPSKGILQVYKARRKSENSKNNRKSWRKSYMQKFR